MDTIDCNRKGSCKTKEVGHQIIVRSHTACYLLFVVFYLFGLCHEKCFFSEKKFFFLLHLYPILAPGSNFSHTYTITLHMCEKISTQIHKYSGDHKKAKTNFLKKDHRTR